MKLIHCFGWISASLLALTAVGCSGGAPTESVDNQQDELRHHQRRHACAGPRDRQCADDRYCASTRPGRCPGDKQLGVCMRRPEVCTDEFNPVCGCDGVTYPNACNAAAVGIAVASPGECAPTFCGGIAGFPCPTGQTCIDDPSDDCDPANGGADCGGICIPETTNPCAAVLCPVGSECVVDGDEASCVPIGACGSAICAAGTVCCNPLMGICRPPGGVCIF